MQITLRPEQAQDHSEVFQVIKKAFENVEYSDQSEPFLVERLRQSEAFVPQLSIVAEVDNKIVGHIILTKIQIDNGTQQFEALALAPVSVLPDFQGKGIGGQLILEAHRQATALGFQIIVLLGHAEYYPKFGYELTSKYYITLPFEAPEENCMVMGLTSDALEGVSGMVIYSKPFLSAD